MNQSNRIRVTIKDTSAGLLTTVEDLTTAETGFMVASAANGFQNIDPNSSTPTSFGFHPEFDTAEFGNFVLWAALQANINFAMEIGHFTLDPIATATPTTHPASSDRPSPGAPRRIRTLTAPRICATGRMAHSRMPPR